jgi:hypothetical protein
MPENDAETCRSNIRLYFLCVDYAFVDVMNDLLTIISTLLLRAENLFVQRKLKQVTTIQCPFPLPVRPASFELSLCLSYS